MSVRSRKRLEIQSVTAATAGVPVKIPRDAAAFTIRAYDATPAPVAFDVEIDGGSGVEFHFAAGEAWTETDLCLSDELDLRVDSAAGTVRVLLWRG